MPTEQFAQQVMTKEARDQEVERQNQRKYFHETRLAKFDADHTMYQADKRQHESIEMKFEAIKASFGAKRAEVGSRVEEIAYKTDLQVEAQAQSNLALEEKKTPLIQIKNRIAGMVSDPASNRRGSQVRCSDLTSYSRENDGNLAGIQNQ
jgi:hypothetical protein